MTRYSKKKMPSGGFAACKDGKPYAFFVSEKARDQWIADMRRIERTKRKKRTDASEE